MLKESCGWRTVNVRLAVVVVRLDGFTGHGDGFTDEELVERLLVREREVLRGDWFTGHTYSAHTDRHRLYACISSGFGVFQNYCATLDSHFHV